MNRFSNKQYLVDILLHSLELKFSHSNNQLPSQVTCEIHYGEGNFLQLNFQPIVKFNLAAFMDSKIRIPFSSQIALVFRLNKDQKREMFLGHYSIEAEKMLAERILNFEVDDKLEESESWIKFEVNIVDKEQLCESDSDQLDLESLHNGQCVSQISEAWKKEPKLNTYKSLTNYHLDQLHQQAPPSDQADIMNIPLQPSEFAKLLSEVDQIKAKKELFAKRSMALSQYKRNSGKLSSNKIVEIEDHLASIRWQKKAKHGVIYAFVALVFFLMGVNLK